jgi:hypothetical protein
MLCFLWLQLTKSEKLMVWLMALLGLLVSPSPATPVTPDMLIEGMP